MMINSTTALIERRVSANLFDTNHTLTNAEIESLVHLATRAPTAFNLQNWRFIALKTNAMKKRLQSLAFDQAKVGEASVTFIICGQLPDYLDISERLSSSIKDGYMSSHTVLSWQESAQALYANPQIARDEAIRSATLGATTLIYAAEALGFASCPMIGFDTEAVIKEFNLGHNGVPVMLVAVGRAAPGNWPQKPRRPVTEVLEIL